MSDNILDINELTIGYNKNDPILKNINLKIYENEILLLSGKNGSGKSTLAKAIINQLPFFKGEIIFKDRFIINPDKGFSPKTHDIIKLNVGVFLQGGRVFPSLTIGQNLSLTDYSSEILDVLCGELKFLERNWRKKASYLSTGERHLLALSMVLSKNPKLLILDEPSAGLDQKNVSILKYLINKTKAQNQMSILLIEHRTEELFSLVDRKVEIIDSEIIKLF